MDRFVHRILKSSTASSIAGVGKSTSGGNVVLTTHHHAPTAVQKMANQELQNAKLLYFGEFHSESRIISFQTELIKEWSTCLGTAASLSSPSASSGGQQGSRRSPLVPTRLHLIMEHFSVDMQSMLDRYAGTGTTAAHHLPFSEDDDEAFEELVNSYKNDYGTEGHDLHPYRHLLQFCRQTTKKKKKADYDGTKNCTDSSNDNDAANNDYCEVHLHGGFIPRNHAARLNKECPDVEAKRNFFDEMSNERGYLPREDDPMHRALFEDTSSFKLRGSPEHQLLIQSLMSGADLYSPPAEEVEGEDGAGGGGNEEEGETPMSRLYEAQLLKDHAMGFRIASLMLDHHDESCGLPHSADRYIVISGFGHLKHYLGVPDCVNGYLRQVALFHSDEGRRAAALDLLLSVTRRPPSAGSGGARKTKLGGIGSALIGCQMMYEACLEDSYPPMIDASQGTPDGDDEDGGAAEQTKRKLLKDLYLQHPDLLDDYILKSPEIRGAFLNFDKGIAGFEYPCADYLFVYDEDDDNIIDDADLAGINKVECPFHNAPKSESMDAKDETVEAYEQVGKTAGVKGNVARARAIMSQIGYTEKDIAYIGDDDLYNFQGVANPHLIAKIQPGEAVLDIGSGLGIDSFLAMRDCGADNSPYEAVIGTGPFVCGVDLAESEVLHATKRASERGYAVPRRIQFIRGDVEKLDKAVTTNTLPMGNFDVCISNGAFCLVPDKCKAFGNVFNALKSGGRMTISTTTIVSDHLDPSFEWPVCMRMFASLESIKPMCERIGFRNVQIIDAESPMEGMEVPVEEEGTAADDGRQRFKIHGKNADQFAFLESMDMDRLCKVVTVYGEKP